jgi:hypothetical protein
MKPGFVGHFGGVQACSKKPFHSSVSTSQHRKMNIQGVKIKRKILVAIKVG